jgi:hypothetical protein
MATGNNGLLDGVRRIGGKFRDLTIDGGLPGAPLGFRIRGATKSGPPVTGTWKAGDQVPDRSGTVWTCVTGGTGHAAAWAGSLTGLAPSGDATGAKDLAAITGLLNLAGRASLQAGQFYINGALAPVSGTTLNGAGPDATIVSQVSTTANGITISATTVANIKITDLRLNGPGSGSGIGLTAVANGGANPVTGLVLDNLIVYEFGSHGVYTQNTVQSRISGIQAVNNLGRGIWGNEGTSTTWINCYANTNPDERGYYFQSMLYSAAIGCASDGNAIGYEADGCDSFTFVSCGAEGTAAGSSGLDGTSIKINGCTNTKVISGRALNNAAVGLYFTGNSQECSVDGFTETATGSPTASIKVDSGCTVTAQSYVCDTAQSFALRVHVPAVTRVRRRGRVRLRQRHERRCDREHPVSEHRHRGAGQHDPGRDAVRQHPRRDFRNVFPCHRAYVHPGHDHRRQRQLHRTAPDRRHPHPQGLVGEIHLHQRGRHVDGGDLLT